MQKTDFLDNEATDYCRSTCKSFNERIKNPLCEFYSTLPSRMTEAKFELISPYTSNQRFAALNVLSALTAMESIILSKGNPIQKLLRTTRNVGFVYVIGGLLLTPEIYNPLMRSD